MYQNSKGYNGKYGHTAVKHLMSATADVATNESLNANEMPALLAQKRSENVRHECS